MIRKSLFTAAAALASLSVFTSTVLVMVANSGAPIA